MTPSYPTSNSITSLKVPPKNSDALLWSIQVTYKTMNGAKYNDYENRMVDDVPPVDLDWSRLAFCQPWLHITINLRHV